MGGTQQVDYDALAQKYGAQSAVDYDALAQKHGATIGNQGERESWLHRTFAPRPVEHRAPTGEMPGSFEGHPENVGEYIPASAGEILGGTRDLTEGKLARGAHRIIGGVGNATLPVIPFVAAGVPAATARTLIGGGIGGTVGSGGARALGASEDQADLAGDVGNIVGGYAGATSSPSNLVRRGINRVVSPVREAFRPRIAAPTREVMQARGLAVGGHAPASEPAEALGRIPVAQEPMPVRSDNVRGPGDIAPEMTRPRSFIARPAEPIPARPGLMLRGEKLLRQNRKFFRRSTSGGQER